MNAGMSASGVILLSHIIFSQAHPFGAYPKDGPIGAWYSISENGYMDSQKCGEKVSIGNEAQQSQINETPVSVSEEAVRPLITPTHRTVSFILKQLLCVVRNYSSKLVGFPHHSCNETKENNKNKSNNKVQNIDKWWVYCHVWKEDLPQDIKILAWSSRRDGLTSWGEGSSLVLVGHPSSNGVTIKMPYGVDVLHRQASHPFFSY